MDKQEKRKTLKKPASKQKQLAQQKNNRAGDLINRLQICFQL
jgi:hypothetical protein